MNKVIQIDESHSGMTILQNYAFEQDDEGFYVKSLFE